MWSHVTVNCHLACNCRCCAATWLVTVGVLCSMTQRRIMQLTNFTDTHIFEIRAESVSCCWDTSPTMRLLKGFGGGGDNTVAQQVAFRGSNPLRCAKFWKGYEFTSKQVCRTYKFLCGCVTDSVCTRVLRRLICAFVRCCAHNPAVDRLTTDIN
jgi:hypothetical protein